MSIEARPKKNKLKKKETFSRFVFLCFFYWQLYAKTNYFEREKKITSLCWFHSLITAHTIKNAECCVPTQLGFAVCLLSGAKGSKEILNWFWLKLWNCFEIYRKTFAKLNWIFDVKMWYFFDFKVFVKVLFTKNDWKFNKTFWLRLVKRIFQNLFQILKNIEYWIKLFLFFFCFFLKFSIFSWFSAVLIENLH